jgi:TonB family protein
MLQPLQLQDVSDHFGKEIAELRDFLSKAGHPALDTPETLGGIAARLRTDRAYRRDLTSNIWVVIHEGGDQTTYSDLLGMLTLAAAGPHLAATADENDAHELLHFLMEARRSYDLVSHASNLPARPVESAVRRAPEPVFLRPVIPIHSVEVAEEDEVEVQDDSREIIWMAAAACLLVALLFGVWWHYKSLANHDAAAALALRSNAPAVQPSVSTFTEAPAVPIHRSSTPAAAARRYVAPSAPSTKPSPVTATARVAALPRANAQPNSAKNKVAAAQPPAPIVRPRLTTPAVRTPLTADEIAAENNPPPFHLLRRQPLSSSANGNNTLIAEPSPTSSPSVATNENNPSSTIHGGVVHPISLGAMASNVMYSPAPAYPTEASAAHVEGEVKLEAEVDSDGNVTSTRVISGPPLLREAATDALEHWRYRPYMYDGKPISMNALVVMDFKLP